mgnify:CR=1 FL=1
MLKKEVADFVSESKALIGDVGVDHIHNDVSMYFNMTEADLSDLDKEGCVRAQYFILQYAISMSQKINSTRGGLMMNKKFFERALSQVYGSYNSFMGHALIVGAACAEHVHLRDIDNEIIKLEALLQEYEGLSARVDKLAQVFRDLSFSKN